MTNNFINEEEKNFLKSIIYRYCGNDRNLYIIKYCYGRVVKIQYTKNRGDAGVYTFVLPENINFINLNFEEFYSVSDLLD